MVYDWCRSRAALGSSRKSPYTPLPTTPASGKERLLLSDLKEQTFLFGGSENHSCQPTHSGHCEYKHILLQIDPVLSFFKNPAACCSTTTTNNQSATVLTLSNNQSIPGKKATQQNEFLVVYICLQYRLNNYLPSLDLSSLVPTPGTINKKAKSRLIDKDGRNRNRLSHTSAPLYFAKSKRPAPTDLDGVGGTNRLPGGQQPVPRRQRSLHTKGKSTNTVQTRHFLHTHNIKYVNTVKPFV